MRAIIGTIPSDSHSWNLVFMQMLLQERGIDARMLGMCTPLDMYTRAIDALEPDLIVVSSINGHGFSQGASIPEHIRSRIRGPIPPIVIGGRLVTDGRFDEAKERALLHAGFDRVFWDANALPDFLSYVETMYRRAQVGGGELSDGFERYPV